MQLSKCNTHYNVELNSLTIIIFINNNNINIQLLPNEQFYIQTYIKNYNYFFCKIYTNNNYEYAL